MRQMQPCIAPPDVRSNPQKGNQNDRTLRSGWVRIVFIGCVVFGRLVRSTKKISTSNPTGRNL
eukprot:5571029-Amphidinium_carterae.1